jgi:modification methylase
MMLVEPHIDEFPAGVSKTSESRNVPLPPVDNTSEGLATLRAANIEYRRRAWPAPFDKTQHILRLGDARDLSFTPDESVHLVVTSPPYWTLKKYETRVGQLGDIDDYLAFLKELDRVWRECCRVLVPGGRVCCVVGDVCIPRRRDGRHRVIPLHADIQVRARDNGLDSLRQSFGTKLRMERWNQKEMGPGFMESRTNLAPL